MIWSFYSKQNLIIFISFYFDKSKENKIEEKVVVIEAKEIDDKEEDIEDEEDDDVDNVDESTDAAAAETKKPKKKKNKKKKKKTAKTQTDPPSVPIKELFPNGIYPIGEILDHPVSLSG